MPGKTWDPTSKATGAGRPTRGPGSAKRRPGHVRGESPRRALDQAGLTYLFNEQKRLNAALRRQSRLVRLDVAEVRSTEAEQLRRINQQIAGGIVTGKGSNPFNPVPLSGAQAKLADLLKRQGKRTIGETPVVRQPPVIHWPTNRRPVNRSVSAMPRPAALSEFLTLRGPLVCCFKRSRDRGYRGSPSQWLRGPTAVREITRLRQKGILDPLWTGRLSVFDRHCPLRYTVTGCTAIAFEVPRKGFFGEVLHKQITQSVSLLGQASSVQRLKKHQWPRDLSGGLAWPTFPTFMESWEILARGKVPRHVSTPAREKLSNWKLPSKRVLPGMMVRTISNMVIGVRATVTVPRKFLAHFKYRWGFLILNRNRPIPNDLARFLASQWKSDISEMFLKFPIRYNEALRRMPTNKYLLVNGWVKASREADVGTRSANPRRILRSLRRSIDRRKSRAQQLSSSSSDTIESAGGVRLC